ncbi:MAG TPA: Na/Pi symporter, partial [Polyangiaceae bacterium LLY-WYZ-15_(1-7)]|nr:Na/Pi symporter [Polyangiaceae bacterium LLY-WYZ-15_(1-7)]
MDGGWFHLVAAFTGGLGFFLLGMKRMTDGLKVAAGAALQRVLEASTRTRLRAFFAGAGITALVQSSSAVTVATLGFVNAGLLDLGGAVWTIFGSNVGTTATGWLVSLSGLDIDLEAWALPLVGAGTLLQLSGPRARRGALGEALAGLGFFFVGLGILSDAFGALAQQVDLAALHTDGALGGVVLFLVGVALTTAMQSSSAAIAVTLTAAGAGLIELRGAAAMVIGANVGTTSTALFATLQATAAARRAAVAHVVFNVLAALVAGALLPALLLGVDAVQEAIGTRPTTAMTLALFHTVFNVVGALLVWPISPRLVAWLERRFRTREEEEARPKHLDANVLQVPSVGLRALALETQRLGHYAGRVALAAAEGREDERARLQRIFDGLLDRISAAVDTLSRSDVPAEVATGLRQLLRTARHYVVVTEQASELEAAGDASLVERLRELAETVASEEHAPDLQRGAELYGALDDRYESRRMGMLEELTAGRGEASETLRR